MFFITLTLPKKNQITIEHILGKYSITSFNLTDDQTIKEISENGRKTLVRNFLSPMFLEKFNDEMRKLSSTEIVNFVTETIGVDSSKQKCQKAIIKMNNLSRNSENEEKFCAFYKRLKLTASEMDGAAEEVKTYFVEKIFKENLTPSMRSFLLEQNSASKSIDEISKLLDKCEKFKKNVNLFQIQGDASDAKIQNLSTMIESLTHQNTSMMNFIKERFSDMDAEICKIRTEPKKSNLTPKRPENEQKLSSGFPSHWEQNAAGFPIRCTKCGYRGHRAQVCRGTNSTCNVCRRQGHISPACPDRQMQDNQQSKN